jgi:hypothetical protein
MLGTNSPDIVPLIAIFKSRANHGHKTVDAIHIRADISGRHASNIQRSRMQESIGICLVARESQKSMGTKMGTVGTIGR